MWKLKKTINKSLYSQLILDNIIYMLINKQLLDTLTAQAKASPRLRMHYDLRNSVEDESQRMLNAIEPGTEIPIHKHSATSEDVVVLRGVAEEVFFDEQGNETGCYQLVPGGDTPAIHIPKGQYHQLRSLQSGTVIFESKNGKYDPEADKNLLNKE